MQRINTTLDDKIADKIKELAEKNKRSASAQISYMIEEIIKTEYTEKTK